MKKKEPVKVAEFTLFPQQWDAGEYSEPPGSVSEEEKYAEEAWQPFETVVLDIAPVFPIRHSEV